MRMSRVVPPMAIHSVWHCNLPQRGFCYWLCKLRWQAENVPPLNLIPSEPEPAQLGMTPEVFRLEQMWSRVTLHAAHAQLPRSYKTKSGPSSFLTSWSKKCETELQCTVARMSDANRSETKNRNEQRRRKDECGEPQ